MSSPADWDGTLLALMALALGYLLGSIPFGLILTRLAGLGDVRKIGSGNIGATNVLRAGSKKLAALTLFLDAAKGTAAVLLASHWGETPALLAGLGAFLGHLFPVWLGFHGGKGVATYIGVLLGLYWPAGVAFCAVWLIVAFATRYSSLSALTASAASVALLAVTAHWPLSALFLLLTVLLFIRHAANIGRLAKGEEARIGESSR
ncbi:glycerol-3-phosphate 1-O-acyltransferase PlsY [Methyloceanibacter sp.]|uniref:glycerol-3-phosphate 1-O-acyltransferase PlsY n=1 Tax=Methyloceanibacter sp. TaxID=1965321 RepID=UPI002D553B7B|nr:glycerol-3-phosphate 1-O-acyltransferase PlsY [Methyloceanibacter sp.]HZP08645.1 glycerol-3-phosphate 1-O-acyltransferase PlsY [Methyloceanibacter sp.]